MSYFDNNEERIIMGGYGPPASERREPHVPKYHARRVLPSGKGRAVCGVDVRLVDDHSRVTCKRCLAMVRDAQMLLDQYVALYPGVAALLARK